MPHHPLRRAELHPSAQNRITHYFVVPNHTLLSPFVVLTRELRFTSFRVNNTSCAELPMVVLSRYNSILEFSPPPNWGPVAPIAHCFAMLHNSEAPLHFVAKTHTLGR